MAEYFTLSENENYSLADISKFNNLCFPIRANHHDYDIFRFVNNPFIVERNDSIYSVTKDGEYVAQMLTMPAPLSLNEKQIPAYWGQDYFVLESHRGEGFGKGLAPLYLGKDYYIAVGFSPKSAAIHQKMGAKKIGYLDYFEKWASPLHRIKFYIERGLKKKAKDEKSYAFPENIDNFRLIKNISDFKQSTLNWNTNTIETLRDPEYLQWRFFYKPNRYFLYQENTNKPNPAYFVAKPYFYKGVNWLKFVDYRFDIANLSEFENILKAGEKLCSQLNLYGIVISSSLKTSNKTLAENSFHQSGHEVVLTTYPFKHEETDDAHNHFMISFADSDLDMHTNTGKFNYD